MVISLSSLSRVQADDVLERGDTAALDGINLGEDDLTVYDEGTFTPIVKLDTTAVDIAGVAASGSITITAAGAIGDSATCVNGLSLAGVNGSSVNEGCNFTNLTVAAGNQAGTTTIICDEDSTTGVQDAGENIISIGVSGVADDAALTDLMVKAINGTADARITYATSGNGQTGVTGITAAEGSSTTQITLTMDQVGTAGNIATVLTEIAGGADMVAVVGFTGGQDIASHNVSIITRDGTVVTATADASTTTGVLATGVNAATFAVDPDSNDNTAENLKDCLAGHGKLTATRGTGGSSAVVTVTQTVTGTPGNTAITLTDPGGTGMSKVDFTGGIDGSFGFYTQIGDRVYLNITCRVNRGSTTGDATVTALPVTSNSDVNNYSTLSFTAGSGVGVDNNPYIVAVIDPNTSVLILRHGPQNTSAAVGFFDDNDIAASTDVVFHISGHYKV